jgi:hypothetical protein
MKNNIKNNFGIDDATVECIRASLANTDVRLDVLADVFGVPLIKAHDICVAFNCRPVPKSTATEVKKPEEPSKPTNEPEFVKAAKSSNPKPEPEIDMMTRLSKMHDYFNINKVFADNFDRFIDESISSLTNNLINIRDMLNSFPDPFINLTAEEIEKYIRPFDNIIALINIENPDKAAYMIKSAFNALLIAHMDARLNNEDEDLHIEYNTTK